MSSATPWGIEAREVQVEVGADFGLPAMQLIGLPDTAVRESRDRVRSAIRNSGYDLKNRNVVINLAPADLKKEGNQLDLAIALGLLTAHRELTTDSLEGRMACGELGLDGEVRPIRGALQVAELAGRLGIRELLLPAANSRQAAALSGTPVIPITHLREAIQHLSGDLTIAPATPLPRARANGAIPDFSDVRGQKPPSERSRSQPPGATTSSSWVRRAPARRCSRAGCRASCLHSAKRKRSPSPRFTRCRAPRAATH